MKSTFGTEENEKSNTSTSMVKLTDVSKRIGKKSLPN